MSRVNEINGENLQDPQSKILATPMPVYRLIHVDRHGVRKKRKRVKYQKSSHSRFKDI